MEASQGASRSRSASVRAAPATVELRRGRRSTVACTWIWNSPRGPALSPCQKRFPRPSDWIEPSMGAFTVKVSTR